MSFDKWWKSVGRFRFTGYSDAEMVSFYGVCKLAWEAAESHAVNANDSPDMAYYGRSTEPAIDGNGKQYLYE